MAGDVFMRRLEAAIGGLPSGPAGLCPVGLALSGLADRAIGLGGRGSMAGVPHAPSLPDR